NAALAEEDIEILAIGDGGAGGVAVLAHHAGEGSLGELGLDLFLPEDAPCLAVEADDEKLEFFLIARVASPEASFPAPLAKSGPPLGDGGTVAGITGEEDFLAGHDWAGSAGPGELDFPENIVLGPLDGQILFIGDAAARAAKAWPIRSQDRAKRQGKGDKCRSKSCGRRQGKSPTSHGKVELGL